MNRRQGEIGLLSAEGGMNYSAIHSAKSAFPSSPIPRFPYVHNSIQPIPKMPKLFLSNPYLAHLVSILRYRDTIASTSHVYVVELKENSPPER